ncbi:MAG: DUF4443 domain-containing protein [Thermoproteus sp. AZ2]|jgi:hypothetical protein|uniref:DUF4443 domain-containing protein n=1 Tax=Thermoproteus sp. AZ2 TaxID=1609232 RepID=A0ACC6V192_9CREN|nr:MAG: hypothetical protein TU35_06700 [Thermoproteus sp. AZ2]
MLDARYLKLLAFLALAQSWAGRRFIAAKLGYGEGVVRRIIEVGRGQGHITVNRAGVKITEAGLAYLASALSTCKLKLLLSTAKFPQKFCGRICVAFSYGEEIKSLVAFRDELVRRGACGAIIMALVGGRLHIPLANMYLEDLDAETALSIKERAKEGETVIMSCGDNFSQALAPIEICDDGTRPIGEDRHPI